MRARRCTPSQEKRRGEISHRASLPGSGAAEENDFPRVANQIFSSTAFHKARASNWTALYNLGGQLIFFYCRPTRGVTFGSWRAWPCAHLTFSRNSANNEAVRLATLIASSAQKAAHGFCFAFGPGAIKQPRYNTPAWTFIYVHHARGADFPSSRKPCFGVALEFCVCVNCLSLRLCS